MGPNRWQLPSVNYMVSIVELHSQLLRLKLELVSGRLGCAHICMLRPDHGYFSPSASLPLFCGLANCLTWLGLAQSRQILGVKLFGKRFFLALDSGEMKLFSYFSERLIYGHVFCRPSCPVPLHSPPPLCCPCLSVCWQLSGCLCALSMSYGALRRKFSANC